MKDNGLLGWHLIPVNGFDSQMISNLVNEIVHVHGFGSLSLKNKNQRYELERDIISITHLPRNTKLSDNYQIWLRRTYPNQFDTMPTTLRFKQDFW